MSREEKWPQIKSAGWKCAFVEVNACTIQIQHARVSTSASTGSLVFHFVPEVNTNSVAVLSKAQTDLDVGLALCVPQIETADRVERSRIDKRAARMRSFDGRDTVGGRQWRLRTISFFPGGIKLVAGSKYPRRHEGLLECILRNAAKTALPKIHPRPITASEFVETSGEVAGLK